jgi:superfamily II DNA or RNA helicase
VLIAKESIDEFLSRPRRSWKQYKRWTRADLLEELDALRVPRRFKTRPSKHQLVGYLVGHLNKRFLFFYDPGLGKTKLTIDLYRKSRGECVNEHLQALVFVPKKVHMGTWEAEAAVHADDVSVCSVDVTSIDAKWDSLMASTADITVIDYMGFGLAVTSKGPGRLKNKRIRDDRKMEQLRRKYHFLALDEMHRVKNQDTMRFRIMRQLFKGAEWAYGLTGTFTGRDPEDMWSQFFLMDGGDTLGETLGLFRASLFTEKKGYFGGRVYKFKDDMLATLHRMMQHRSLTYEEGECFDLPSIVPVERKFNMNAEQREVYGALRKGRIIEGVRVPLDGVFHRMRECTSGYQRLTVNGVPVIKHFAENPKLDLIETDVCAMAPDSKGIIFYNYKPTGDLLAKMLTANGIKHLRLDGATKNPRTIEATFREDERQRILLANYDSGSEGINAQVANYEFFYEAPSSPIVRAQAIKRTARQGQSKRCFVFDYLARNSVDENVVTYAQQGIDMLAALKRGGDAVARALVGV